MSTVPSLYFQGAHLLIQPGLYLIILPSPLISPVKLVTCSITKRTIMIKVDNVADVDLFVYLQIRYYNTKFTKKLLTRLC